MVNTHSQKTNITDSSHANLLESLINYRDINLENFKQDIMVCNFVTTKSVDIEELSQLYNIYSFGRLSK